jgi:hypothetical protein
MKCSSCNTENPDVAVYCSQCGHRFSESEKQTPVTLPAQSAFIPSLPRGNGVLILIFGVLGLVLCAPLGIAAWLMGNSDLQKMRQGLMARDEEGITQTGRILGIIATVLFVLIVGGLILALGLAFNFLQPEAWHL